MCADPLGEQAPLGLLDLAREQLRRELVGLVEDDEVPVGRVVEEELEVLVAAELVEPGDQQVRVGERVARRRALDPVAGQEREVEVELLGELGLPLLDERARGTMRQRRRSPRTMSSRMKSPVMIVLPAPGSSASRKLSGWRGSIAS